MFGSSLKNKNVLTSSDSITSRQALEHHGNGGGHSQFLKDFKLV